MRTAALVVSYHSSTSLGACLRALRRELPARSPLLVWDNGSQDSSVEVARRAAPGALVVAHRENAGFAAAVNAAAARLAGCHLLLVNPDAVPEPCSVAVLMTALDRDPRLAVVGGTIREKNGRAVSAWSFPTPGRAILGSSIGLGRAYRVTTRSAGAGVEVLSGGFVPFTYVLLRRQAFDALGGLDESFWLYGEDADYCFRAERAGWRIALAPSAGARHAGRGSSASVTDALRRQLDSEDRFRRKHFDRRRAWLAERALLVGAFARLVVLALLKAAGRDNRSRRREWHTVLAHYAR